MSRGGEQIKVSEIAGLIDQIQAGGGESQIAVLCDPLKFTSICYGNTGIGGITKEFETTYSTKLVFTDIKAPEDTKVVDVSAIEDNSVVAWLDSQSNTLNISSQEEGKKIYFAQGYDSIYSLSYFNFISFLDDRGPRYDSYIKSVDLSNLYPLTRDLNHFFYNAGALNSIDISHWEMKPLNVISMFESCSNLSEIDISGLDLSDPFTYTAFANTFKDCGASAQSETVIYAQEWTKQNNYVQYATMFTGASKLPNFSSTSGSMAKWKENGGYFTNPAEREN